MLTVSEILVLIICIGSVVCYLLFGDQIEHRLHWYRQHRRIAKAQRMLRRQRERQQREVVNGTGS